MSYTYWPMLGLLLIPGRITEQQELAAANLEARARMSGGFVEIHGDVKRHDREEKASA